MSFDFRFPNGVFTGLGRKDEDILSFFLGVVLSEHEPNKRLSKANPIGEESPTMNFRPLF